MTDRLIALFDVGKTNTKLSLIDAQGAQVWSARRANVSVQGAPCRALDVEAIERWLLENLQSAPGKERISAIVPVAHGACAVLMDGEGRCIVAPDYEDTCYEAINERYDAARDSYRDTWSPALPAGLNLARQWFFLQERHEPVFARTRHLVLYPQYWAWRLSGVLASEVTSLGCHTDLWRPQQRTYSRLAMERDWAGLLPPVRPANETLGPVSAPLAATLGLDPECRVVCGIHDSNASYLRFLIGREQQRFTVVSSGTWTVVMANRGDLTRLQEHRDMLANVDAFGSPVATARFMGGREFEMIGADAAPTLEALRHVINVGALALPSFAAGGPFGGSSGRVVNAGELCAAARASLATAYVALMTEVLIESLGAGGEVLIDGPLTRNPLFGPLLATCLPSSTVKVLGADQCARSALYLAGLPAPRHEDVRTVMPLQLPGFDAYRAHWRASVQA